MVVCCTANSSLLSIKTVPLNALILNNKIVVQRSIFNLFRAFVVNLSSFFLFSTVFFTMKFLVATIFIALIAIAMAHPPADEVKPENEQKEQQEQKPIDEAAPAPVETPSDEKLPVKIYYEGLCPDSRKLMHELGMDYYTFRKYINLDFIPFGRAKSLDADGNGFECHHGPAECVANIVHSCGIQYLKSVDAKQQFVVCQMRTEAEVTGKAVSKY